VDSNEQPDFLEDEYLFEGLLAGNDEEDDEEDEEDDEYEDDYIEDDLDLSSPLDDTKEEKETFKKEEPKIEEKKVEVKKEEIKKEEVKKEEKKEQPKIIVPEKKVEKQSQPQILTKSQPVIQVNTKPTVISQPVIQLKPQVQIIQPVPQPVIVQPTVQKSVQIDNKKKNKNKKKEEIINPIITNVTPTESKKVPSYVEMITKTNQDDRIQEVIEDTNNEETFGELSQTLGSLEEYKSQTKEIDRGQQETDQSLRILNASLKHIPYAYDSERPKPYVPLNPYTTPEGFTTKPLPIFNDPTLFEKMDVDTLFFIFYYQQGTYQQYLAGKELKKQAWRYHKKYLTWFQRHDQPQITTTEYELGTYVYFDYETDWCQRIKSGFRFEYEYLEDELHVT